jgi:hypothetical protein
MIDIMLEQVHDNITGWVYGDINNGRDFVVCWSTLSRVIAVCAQDKTHRSDSTIHHSFTVSGLSVAATPLTLNLASTLEVARPCY